MDLLKILATHRDDLIRRANVVAVGIGRRTVRGVDTGEICLKVYVTEKLTRSALGTGDVIPSHLSGLKTDVEESGKILKRSHAESKFRPISGGSSVGPAGARWAGTLGLGVRDARTQEPLILSNEHVLGGEGTIPVGTPVLQPAVLDGGANPSDRIGTYARGVTPRPGKANFVDAAVARLDRVSDWSAEVLGVGAPTGLADLNRVDALGTLVSKSGRTTGATFAKVVGIHTTVFVGYDSGVARFDEQIVLSFSALPGDSGSCVFDLQRRLGALLFAGSEENHIEIVSPIQAVFSELGIELGAPHAAPPSPPATGARRVSIYRNQVTKRNLYGLEEEAAGLNSRGYVKAGPAFLLDGSGGTTRVSLSRWNIGNGRTKLATAGFPGWSKEAELGWLRAARDTQSVPLYEWFDLAWLDFRYAVAAIPPGSRVIGFVPAG